MIGNVCSFPVTMWGKKLFLLDAPCMLSLGTVVREGVCPVGVPPSKFYLLLGLKSSNSSVVKSDDSAWRSSYAGYMYIYGYSYS